MLITDQHVHFTGSLPADFISSRAQELGRYDKLIQDLRQLIACPPASLQPVTGLRALLGAVRQASQSLHSGWFYDLYAAIQAATHPEPDASEAAIYRYYTQAFAAIAASRRSERLAEIHTFLSVDESSERLDLKLMALEDFARSNEGIRLLVRLTISRSLRLSSANLHHMLSAVEQRIAKRSAGYDLVAGLDISGDEGAEEWPATRDLLQELTVFRHSRAAAGQPLSVSIHLGEDLHAFSAVELLGRFDDIARLGVDSVGHAVFLWIPEDRLIGDRRSVQLVGFKEDRSGLLQRLLREGIKLEICPTTSLTTQPLLGVGDLPTRRMSFAPNSLLIGTDSPALLNTTLPRELARAGIG